jgi:hypothetical protein
VLRDYLKGSVHRRAGDGMVSAKRCLFAGAAGGLHARIRGSIDDHRAPAVARDRDAAHRSEPSDRACLCPRRVDARDRCGLHGFMHCEAAAWEISSRRGIRPSARVRIQGRHRRQPEQAINLRVDVRAKTSKRTEDIKFDPVSGTLLLAGGVTGILFGLFATDSEYPTVEARRWELR